MDKVREEFIDLIAFIDDGIISDADIDYHDDEFESVEVDNLWVWVKQQSEAKDKEIAELRSKVPPIENGKNQYGVDVSYFRNLINRELNRNLSDFRPDELARVFARASRTADPKVMHEDEFKLNER